MVPKQTPLKYFFLTNISLVIFLQISAKNAIFSYATIGSILIVTVGFALLELKIKGFIEEDFYELKGKSLLKTAEPHSRDSIFFMGRQYETELDQGQEEERFMRLGSLNSRIRQSGIMAIYIFLVTIFFLALPTSAQKSSILNLAIVAIACLPLVLAQTASHILTVPFFLLIGFSFYTENFNINFSFSFATFLLFLTIETHQRFKYNEENLNFSLKQSINNFIPFLAILIFINITLPEKPEHNSQNSLQGTQEINQKLGGFFYKDRKQNQLKNLRNATQSASLDANDLLKLGQRFDNIEGALDSISKKLLNEDIIMRSKVGDLRRSLAESRKKHTKLINTHQMKKTLNPQENLQGIALVEKLEALEKSLEHNFQNHFNNSNYSSRKSQLSRNFQQRNADEMTKSHKAFKELKESLKIEDTKEIEKKIEKVMGSLEKTGSASLTERNKFSQIIRTQADSIENQSPNFINPKFLEEVVSICEKVLIVLLSLLVFKLLLDLFRSEEIDPVKDLTDEEISEIKKILRSKKYKSQEEEIHDLYKRYESLVQILFFQESQTPPPGILKDRVQEKIRTGSRALMFMTEVFSSSYYGGQKFDKKVLNKYRRAHKKVTRRLTKKLI